VAELGLELVDEVLLVFVRNILLVSKELGEELDELLVVVQLLLFAVRPVDTRVRVLGRAPLSSERPSLPSLRLNRALLLLESILLLLNQLLALGGRHRWLGRSSYWDQRRRHDP
jgi:hypothetical protein